MYKSRVVRVFYKQMMNGDIQIRLKLRVKFICCVYA